MLSKGKVGKYALLRHKKYREKEGLFLVQGRKGVEDTLCSFDVECIILRVGENVPQFLNGYPVEYATDGDIRKISTLETLPGMIGVYRIPKIFDNSEDLQKRFTLVLDGVQDPGNLGTIIRTAHWFGVHEIYCSEDTVDIYNPKVVQSTMGSLGKVKVKYCDLDNLFAMHSDIPVYGLLLEGESLFECKDLTPGFIVMGSEGNGIREEIKRRVTRPLTIPAADPANHPESLNVAIATAITLSQIVRPHSIRNVKIRAAYF